MRSELRRGTRRVLITGGALAPALIGAAVAGVDLETLRGCALAVGVIVGIVLTPAAAIVLSSRRDRLALALVVVALVVATVAASALGYLLAYPLAGATSGELVGGGVSIIALYTVGASVGGALIAAQLLPRRQRQRRHRRSTTAP